MDFSLFLVLFCAFCSTITGQEIKFNVVPIKQEILYVDVPFAPPPTIEPIEIGSDEAIPLQLNFKSQSRNLRRNIPIRHHAVIEGNNARQAQVQTIQFQTQAVKPRTQIFNSFNDFQQVKPASFVQKSQSQSPKPVVFTSKPFNFQSSAINPSASNFRFQRIGDSDGPIQQTVSQPQPQPFRNVNFGTVFQTQSRAFPKPVQFQQKPVSFQPKPVQFRPQPVQSFSVRPIPNGRNLPLFVSNQPQIVLADTQQLGPAPMITTEQLVNNIIQQVNAQPVVVSQPVIETEQPEGAVEVHETPAPVQAQAPALASVPVAAPVAQPRQIQTLRQPIRLQIVPTIRENLNKFTSATPVAPAPQVQAVQAVQVAQPVVTEAQTFAVNQNVDLQSNRQIVSTSEPQISNVAEIERSNNENLIEGIQALLGNRNQASALSTSVNTNFQSSLDSFIQELTSKSQADANPLFINGEKKPAA